MVVELQMPALSPTMTEGKIVVWNKKEGDNLSVGDVILEVETDKAVMEVESQNKGILGKILVEDNKTVAVGATIALILEKNEDLSILKDYKVKNIKQENETESKTETNTTESNVIINNEKNKVEENIPSSNDIVFASPLAKKIAKLNNIDIKNISGHGPNGRVVKADVENFLKNDLLQKNKKGRNSIEFTDIEPSGMRKTIANRLTESKQQTPHWYLKIKVDMTNFLKFKEEINKDKKDNPKLKISVNDIIVMAVSQTLSKHPKVNASWINGKIRKYNNIDVSIAVAVNDGIFTPIIKNSDQMSLIQISEETKRLIEKTRNGKLLPQEFQGGSIAISNLGMYGVQEFYSIINQPQSCIIAVGSIENSPAVVNEKIVACPTCVITISADHRVIDGADLALFASDLKKMLEDPAIMLFYALN